MKSNPLHPLRERIIASVPEIVELKFGCVVDRGAGEDVTEIFVSEAVGDISLMRRNSLGDWQPFLVSSELRKTWKIVGRPITLQDVLLTFEKKYDKQEADTQYWRDRAADILDIIRHWNLRETLEGQSEETLEFILKLLV